MLGSAASTRLAALVEESSGATVTHSLFCNDEEHQPYRSIRPPSHGKMVKTYTELRQFAASFARLPFPVGLPLTVARGEIIP